MNNEKVKKIGKMKATNLSKTKLHYI